MEPNDEPVVPVMFKIHKHGITAVFPTFPGTNDPDTMTCYAHVGQHGFASQGWVSRQKTATPEQYKELYDELVGLGYKLRVVRRGHRLYREARIKEINRPLMPIKEVN